MEQEFGFGHAKSKASVRYVSGYDGKELDI